MESQKLLVPINFDGLLTIAQFYARMNGVGWRYEARTFPPYATWSERLKRLIIVNHESITDSNGPDIRCTYVVVEENPMSASFRKDLTEWDYEIEIRSYTGSKKENIAARIPPWFVEKKERLSKMTLLLNSSSEEEYVSLHSRVPAEDCDRSMKLNWNFETIREIFQRLRDSGCNREGPRLILWGWQEEDLMLRDVTSAHGKPMIELEYMG